MELKYPVVAMAGVILAGLFVALCIFFQFRTNKETKGIKLANAELIYKDKYYKRTLVTFYILKVLLITAVTVSLSASFVLLAKPYYQKKIKKEQYNRDIMICLDISSSVDDLNLKLVRELQDTVRSLSGERIGIVIFNTSPVLLSPVSDDYEYTITQLENIRTAIKEVNKSSVHMGSDWLKWDNFLYGGTLVGNETRGSSLIADGLMGGLLNFPKDGGDRTKVIIFATDNDKNGEGYLSLQEAADYCTKAGVTVYGIGTKLMYPSDREEMKKAMESTGGKFYIEEDGEAFEDIVKEIEAKSASLVKGKTIIKEVEQPKKCFYFIVFTALIVIIVSIVLRRANVWFYIGSVVVAASLVLTFIFGVIPAEKFSKGPDFEVKKNSSYKVLFVVDDTISMLANDGPDGMERLTKAKMDCESIIDELEGARFGVISFNNDATVMMPFNNNASHAKNVINSIYPLESMYADGTGAGTPVDVMKSILEEGEGKTCVFYLGDGEITNTEATAKSYSELASFIDTGAVLGYGTKTGGTMRVKNLYDDEYVEIIDYSTYPFEPGVSRIDEDNLNKIAKETGLVYINANGDISKLSSVISKAKGKMDVKEEVAKNENDENDDSYIKPPQNYGYLWMIPGIIMMLVNMVYIIKKK